MNDTNTNLTMKGNPLPVEGIALKIGDVLPSVSFIGNSLNEVPISQFLGKPCIVSLVPSIDTPTCSIETARFNQEASGFEGKAAVVTISADLPFAQARWCAAEGAKNLTTVSAYRNTKRIGEAFGAYLPGAGLLARTVIVADKNGVIQHVEYVKELSDEPQYEMALKKLRELL